MRLLKLFAYILITSFMAMSALAVECTNSGAPPSTAPNDTDDGDALACGALSVAGGDDSTALGRSASSTGDYSIALGYISNSSGQGSIALGAGATSAGPSSSALGDDASSAGEFSTAVGYSASASGNYSHVLGAFASSSGTVSIALGYLANSSNAASTALGAFSVSSSPRGTALGFRAYADQPDTVILGSIAGVNGADDYANVGMGTSAPVEAVDVERSAAAARFQLTSFTATASEAPQYIQRRARGTRLAPTAVLSNDNLGLFSFRGHNGTAMGGSRATITAQAAGNFTDSSTPTRLIFSTTPVGSTAPQSVLVITPDGKVQVKGVNLNVPDYVFEDDYELMPLDELKSFIDKNGHLPGITPAHEVKSEGLDLAGSQLSQLQKIEELTLYTLQQEQRLKELQAKSDRLEAMVSLLMQERDKS